MAHVGQELALGAAGVLGGFLGLAQLGFALQQFLLALAQPLLSC